MSDYGDISQLRPVPPGQVLPSRSYLSELEAAERVFDVLSMHAQECPLRQLAVETGLTEGQAYRGISYIRRVLADERTEPIIYVQRTATSEGGYKLALTEGEVYPYVRARFGIALTQLRRLRSAAVNPAMRKFATSAGVPDRLDELAEDIELVERRLERLLRHLPTANGQTAA